MRIIELVRLLGTGEFAPVIAHIPHACFNPKPIEVAYEHGQSSMTDAMCVRVCTLNS